LSKDFDLVGSTIDCLVPVSDNLFIGNEIEFEAHISFNQPLNWVNCEYRVEFRYYDGKTGFLAKKNMRTYYRSLTNNNSSDVASTNIDLFKSLPDIKCVDFLSSFSRLLIFQYSILHQITRGLFG
jgi:hypothetical protein